MADLLRKGAAAAASHRYEACVGAYAAALLLGPPQAKIHRAAAELGLCEEALGHFVQAYNHLLFALEAEVPGAEVPGANGSSKGVWKRYRAAFERVSERVVRTIVLVRPTEAEVLVDGKSLGTQVSGRYFALTPGVHTWTARLEGYEDCTVAHLARAGDIPDLTLVLTKRASGDANQGSGQGPDQKAGEKPGSKPGTTADTKQGVSLAREPPWRGARCDAICADHIWHELRKRIEGRERFQMDPSLLVIAGALMSAGFTADVGAGFMVSGEARWGAPEELGFSLGLEVRTLLPATGGLWPDGKPLTISLVTAGLAPCIRYRWGLGCLVVDGGAAISGGAPPPVPIPNDSPFYGNIGFGPRLGVNLFVVERFGVRAFGDVRISPVDIGIYYHKGTETGTLWKNPIVSGLFGLGVFFT